MKSTPSTTTKFIILIVIALLFSATMIALSLRPRHGYTNSDTRWDKSRTIEKNFAVQQGGQLILDSDVGDVRVIGSEGDEVRVTVKFNGPVKYQENIDVDFDQDGNSVTITGKNKKKYFNFFSDDWFEVQYEIELPTNFNLDIHTAGGDIFIQDAFGNIQGETSGGDIHLIQLDGVVRVVTSGGDIDVKGSKGDVMLKTSGGDVRGEFLTGVVDIETSGGDIIIEDSDAKLNASTSGGDIRVELKDNKGIDVSTSGGTIKITLPKTITADVDAETTGGEVNCDFEFSGKLKDGSLQGKINGGGLIIKAETSGGDIIINPID